MKTKTSLSSLVLTIFVLSSAGPFAGEVRTVRGDATGVRTAQWETAPNNLSPGWYISGLFRGNFMENARLRQLLGAPSSGTVKFDPGAGFSARGGYRFCEFFALEGEFGFDGNDISSMTGASFDNTALFQVPMMANAVLTVPTRTAFMPYGGFGLGGTTSILDTDRITAGAVSVTGTESTTTFSWQAFGGLDYAITDRLSVGLMYNYRSVEGPKWDRGSFPIEFGRLRNHSLSARVNFRF